ncbi:MAG: DUF4105 domain-containing protein [Planctomycetes bacterium]|nr:DUF4105 domain-containing protein [Planctomycetota bacterium]
MLALAAPTTLWMAGAIRYDLCQTDTLGRLFAACWVVSVGFLFAVWQPVWQPFAFLMGVTGIFLVWWLRLKPSHDRDWDPSVAVLPRVSRHEDELTLENVRNFEYRSLNDFTPRYETRTVHFSNLRGADIIFFNWGSPWMSHPVLVFDFGTDGRICISIEVRYRKGQKYAIVRSFYRQQELIYLVADERDVILRRTKHSPNQTAHLYHMTVSLDIVQKAFLDYVGAINDLYETPHWYHGLFRNCTTTFYRLPSSRSLRDFRVLLNGRLDLALYENGRLDRSLPFDELKRLALINDIANGAPEADFGGHLRRELERRCHEQ